jgi:dipeptidyl aminopeptidase/acylaminoacyl peptidase
MLVAASIGASLAPAAGSPKQAPPWSARPTTTILQEERVFQNAGADLRGTLYLPEGGKALGAVVVTHAASLPLRSEPLYGHLKEMLPPLGIAVFVYDRRGSGKSSGDLKTSDYTLLADDAVAAARMLASDPRIDSKRVGIWGLSQGGWLALLAASRSRQVAFAVSSSAPIVTPDVQMIFLAQNILRVNGYSQGDIDQAVATRRAVDDYMRGKVDRATAQRMVDAAKVKPWFKLIYMSETVGDRSTSRWRKEIEHDPARTLDKVKVPVLMIYGAGDPIVPVATSVEHLQATAGEHPNVEVAVIARADHHMEISVDLTTQLDPTRFDEKPEAPEYFGILASWLTRQGIARRGP